MSLQSFINSTLNESQIEHKIVLDPENKSELKQHTFCVSDKNLNTKCPITMAKFKDGDQTTMLPCGHIFNTESIEEWVMHNQAKCPVCRHELKHTKEIRITPDIQETSQNNDIHIEENPPQMNSRLLRAFMNYILSVENEIINEENFPNDISNNQMHIIPNNNSNGPPPVIDISNNTEDISGNSDLSGNVDVVYNNINNYISMLDNIIHREIQRQTDEQENDIMQRAILASLQNQ